MDESVRTSELLRRLTDTATVGAELTMTEAVHVFGQAGLVLLMLILGLINIVLVPLPGISTIFGFPLFVASIAYAAGVKDLWVPRALRDKALKTEDVARSLSKGLSWLERIEHKIHPRAPYWQERPGLWVAQGALILAAFILVLPIPFCNIPPAIAIVVLCVGLLEKDGLVIAGGVVLSALQLVYALLLLLVFEQSLSFLFGGHS